MKSVMISVDLAKILFQVHGVDATGQVVVRRQLRRRQLEGFFASHEPAVIGMEACGAAHHWARLFAGLVKNALAERGPSIHDTSWVRPVRRGSA